MICSRASEWIKVQHGLGYNDAQNYCVTHIVAGCEFVGVTTKDDVVEQIFLYGMVSVDEGARSIIEDLIMLAQTRARLF